MDVTTAVISSEGAIQTFQTRILITVSVATDVWVGVHCHGTRICPAGVDQVVRAELTRIVERIEPPAIECQLLAGLGVQIRVYGHYSRNYRICTLTSLQSYHLNTKMLLQLDTQT